MAEYAILVGALLGLSLAAPPGPMNALIAQQSAHGGWMHGIRIGIAAPIADTIYLVIFATGIAPWLSQETGLLRILAGLGGALMAWFAYDAWKAKEAEPAKAGFAKAFAMSMTNPYQITWWLTAGIVFASDQGALWVIGFLTGIFGWVIVFSGLVAAGARKWHWFAPTIRVFSTLVLALFAVVMMAFAAGWAIL